MRTTGSNPSPSASGGRSDTLRTPACAAAIAGAILLGGCARPAGVIFDLGAGVHEWPPPPDRARIRYLGQLTADVDLKPARPFGQRVGAALFGRKAVKTMLSPIAVCTDGGDRVFVADSNAQLVHVFDLSTRKYQRWLPPKERGAFSQPVGVAFDPAGRLLVADSAEGALFAFDREGAFLGVLGENLDRPCSVWVEPVTRRVFVADSGAHQVVVLSPEGDELRRLGSRGAGPGEFNFPTSVVTDAEGRLFVSDSLNFRVQVFGPDLAPIRRIGDKGDMPGSFAQPKGITIGPEGHVYVVDAHFEAVQLFDPHGTLLMTFGREGRGPGEFWLPVGIHADPQGRVWVADSYNRRVQAFQYLRDEVVP